MDEERSVADAILVQFIELSVAGALPRHVWTDNKRGLRFCRYCALVYVQTVAKSVCPALILSSALAGEYSDNRGEYA